MYDLTVELFFLGRRHSSYKALVRSCRCSAWATRALDVGCSTGYFARAIAAAVGSAGLVIGIDPGDWMIQYARQKAAAIRNREFQVGVAEALPFPGDHFDAVVSSLVIHHLPEDLRVRAVEEMRRVLRPGGRLLVAEGRNPRHGILSLLARARLRSRGAASVRSGPAGVLQGSTTSGMAKFLRGFVTSAAVKK